MEKRVYFRKTGIKLLCLISIASMAYTANVWASEEGTINLGSVKTTEYGKERSMKLSGRAMLIKHKDGTSAAYTQVTGLSPATTYGAHVHNLPCELGGGGHYKNDPNIDGAIEDNEIWVSFVTNDAGIGLGQGAGDFSTRPEAQSIVIHDTDGARIGCADLSKNYEGATVQSGNVNSFSDGESFGKAQLNRSNGSTYSTLHIKGLVPDTTYPTHVHNLPCNVNSGGSHYKIDPTQSATLTGNEIWLTVTTDDNGTGSSVNVTEGHTARPEAQSVVIHAPDGSRIGCANLSADESKNIKTYGDSITTEAGLARGFDLDGSAKMERKVEGRTGVKIEIEGLGTNTTYPTHVHNLPCKLGGGSHYKIDSTIGETVADNEIWPFIKTNKKGKGKAHAVVQHIARPEAQSIVIHDPLDGARIGCFDLD